MEQQAQEQQRWHVVLFLPQMPQVIFEFETEEQANAATDKWLESFRVDHTGSDGVRHKIALPGAALFTLMSHAEFQARTTRMREQQQASSSQVVLPVGLSAVPRGPRR